MFFRNQAIGCGVYFSNSKEDAKNYGNHIITIKFPEVNWNGENYDQKYICEAEVDIGVIDDVALENDERFVGLNDEEYDKMYEKIFKEYCNKAMQTRKNQMKKGCKMTWRYVPEHEEENLQEIVFNQILI